METTVVNIYKIQKGWERDSKYVYIGRKGKGHDGYFGNPIPLNSPGICPVCSRSGVHNDRGSTLVCYEKYARRRISEDPIFREAVKALQGHTLVCFCKPQACHGDILVKLCIELNLNVEQIIHDLREMDSKLNDGHGVQTIKSCILLLERGDISQAADLVGRWDHDKLYAHPEVEEYLLKTLLVGPEYDVLRRWR